VKASPRIACHKIQWLQFANKNIVESNLGTLANTSKFQELFQFCTFNSTLTATSA
jgi:hypothetical protein